MENSTFFLTYLLTFLFCIAVTVSLIYLANKGLKRFFKVFSQDNEIARFFVRMTNIIILLGGVSAALKSGYNTGEKSNWLTLVWDSAAQIQESLGRLFTTLIVLTITFFILYMVSRLTKK